MAKMETGIEKTRDQKRKARKMVGSVVSVKQKKTLTVTVDRVKTHPLYRKKYNLTRRFQVHYDEGEFKKGDVVEFQQVAPISKNKRFKVLAKKN